MIRHAIDDGLPRGTVLADSAYGSSSDFGQELRDLGLDYAVGVDPKTVVWLLDAQSRCRGDPVSVRELALRIEAKGGFRAAPGAKGRSRIFPPASPSGESRLPAPTRSAMHSGSHRVTRRREGACQLLPRELARKQSPSDSSSGWSLQRWRTERVYEDLKGELGLDHFEGRRFRGWHHHVSVALCCYAFVVAARVQRLPPRPEGRWETPGAARGLSGFSDSFNTARLSIARTIAGWLPRCPACHRPRNL